MGECKELRVRMTYIQVCVFLMCSRLSIMMSTIADKIKTTHFCVFLIYYSKTYLV